jgi:hypothetical protein
MKCAAEAASGTYISAMEPIAEPLSFYGSESDCPSLEWQWVDEQLRRAGTYWVVPRSDGAPHARPLWGLWDEQRLLLSVGSKVVARQLAADAPVTVHLDSGTDVVIVEGTVEGERRDQAAIAQYDAKYDWTYEIAEYGPLTVVRPTIVRAWQTAGWAGRDGFRAAGRWRFA